MAGVPEDTPGSYRGRRDSPTDCENLRGGGELLGTLPPFPNSRDWPNFFLFSQQRDHGGRKGGVMVEEEHTGLLGWGATHHLPAPGCSPRWRQAREENRKWEQPRRRAGPGWGIARRGEEGFGRGGPGCDRQSPPAGGPARPGSRTGEGAAQPVPPGPSRRRPEAGGESGRGGCGGCGALTRGAGRLGRPQACGTHVTGPTALSPAPRGRGPFKNRPRVCVRGGGAAMGGPIGVHTRTPEPEQPLQPPPPPGKGNKFEQQRPAPFPSPAPPRAGFRRGSRAGGGCDPSPRAPAQSPARAGPGAAGEGTGGKSAREGG